MQYRLFSRKFTANSQLLHGPTVGIGPYKRERNQIMEFPKKEKDNHLGLRIDSELHYKLHYISQYDGRSANGEVIYLIRQRIERFEREHGRIELPD